MRIAVLSWSNRMVGGVEEYLGKFLPAASAAGHEVGFWYETEAPSDRAAIPAPSGGEWSVERLGAGPALAALRQWRPDLIYAHGLQSPELEEEAYKIAPTVFFIHVYVGTCISGAKTTWLPVATPCDRRFGPACLAHYFPRRCGGLSPVTMWRLYRLQSRRLHILRQSAAVVTHSEHMRDEYVRNGIAPDRMFAFPYYVTKSAPEEQPPQHLRTPPTLLFLGRMEDVKGGRLLLDALPRVRSQLDRPLRVLFAGDGRARARWEARAARLQARDPGLRVEFLGWVDAVRRASLFGESDLLVVPSIWPEPFGQVGPQAGAHGVPAVAFKVGGTPSWLIDGENGYLAPGDPPTAAGLAEAIARSLIDPVVHQQLRNGALTLAGRFTWSEHYAALMETFTRVLGSGVDPSRVEQGGRTRVLIDC